MEAGGHRGRRGLREHRAERAVGASAGPGNAKPAARGQLPGLAWPRWGWVSASHSSAAGNECVFLWVPAGHHPGCWSLRVLSQNC